MRGSHSLAPGPAPPASLSLGRPQLVELPSAGAATASAQQAVAAPKRKAAKKRRTNVKAQRKPKSTFGPKRRHKTYLSATQIAERDAHAAFESKVLNLTLDMNDLRQLIRMLEERRDLHVTRLMLARDQFKTDILRAMGNYMRVFGALSKRRTCSELTEFLARIDPCMVGPGMNAKGSLPHFVWQWGCYNNRFHHWHFNELSTRIVTFIEEDSGRDEERLESSTSIQVCGPGGCVVETVGEFTGCPTRAMVAAMFPHLLCDEGYTASLTLQPMRFPTRMIVYFNARGKIVKHDLEADAFAALQAIVEATASNRSSIPPSERFTELPALPSAACGDSDDMAGSSDFSGDGSSNSAVGSEASSTRSRQAVSYLLSETSDEEMPAERYTSGDESGHSGSDAEASSLGSRHGIFYLLN
jgi:hypothetical protein